MLACVGVMVGIGNGSGKGHGYIIFLDTMLSTMSEMDVQIRSNRWDTPLSEE